MCPMHAGAAGHEKPRCEMRAACDVPFATLASLFALQGLLPSPLVIRPDVAIEPVAIERPENLTSLLASPDTPPPRA